MYDPEEYAEEWDELARSGLTAEEIIDRSAPDAQWFIKNVQPLARVSRCSSCRTLFDTQTSASLLLCGDHVSSDELYRRNYSTGLEWHRQHSGVTAAGNFRRGSNILWPNVPEEID